MKLVVAAAAVGAIGCLGLPTAGADLVGFTSPSGNIGCILADGTVRCDVAERDWAPPPRPSDCPDFTDYGQGITLGTTGRASFVCAGSGEAEATDSAHRRCRDHQFHDPTISTYSRAGVPTSGFSGAPRCVLVFCLVRLVEFSVS